MIIVRGKLNRTLTQLVLTAVILMGGCKWFAHTPDQVTYSAVESVAGVGEIGEPFGIAIKDGVIYFSDGEKGTIRRIGSDEAFASGLNTPSAIAFLPNGELVVADTGSNTIKKISLVGEVTLLAGVDGQRGAVDGPALSATFNAPIGVAVAADGAIYVSDTYNDRIRLIRDGVVSTIAGSTRGYADGNGGTARFDTPLGVAVWGDRLVIADSGNGRIRLVEQDGGVRALAGSDTRDLVDGPLSSAKFVNPTAITVDQFGRLFVADGNAIRMIGGRIFPIVETVAGDRRGFHDGERLQAQFNRPSGLAIAATGEIYIADSDNSAIRMLSDGKNKLAKDSGPVSAKRDDQLPLANRWPFDPPSNPREIAGTLGEIRGEIGPDNKPVWFHNGLDIAGAYGETARFIRDEAVLNPMAAENFGTSRELLRMPLIGYIHLRLGRDKDDREFGDPRFQFDRDPVGKLTGVRVPRGVRFGAGHAIGTLNSMNHVHLIAGRSGHEINALAALELPGIVDSIAPVIEDVALFNPDWEKISPDGRTKLADRTRVVVRAYDRMDKNSDRRRLGVYRIGYQIFSNGFPDSEIKWNISFDRMPSNDAVRFAYAAGSQSGYTPNTVFDYVATNRIDGDFFSEGFLDASTLPTGSYTLRVFAADYFGNVTSKDVKVPK